jgi:AcrR family transcriptional regulator
MARMLKPTAHAARRDAFVDAAQRLIRSRGYEQMSVQNVLDDLGASRGAFYHYFDSKVALLEAVVERMVDESIAGLQPLLAETNLGAIDKLRGLFAGVAHFKAADRELVSGLTRTWLSDDNALARDKLRRLTVERLTPVLAVIVRQGQREGSFVPASPAATARVLVSLWQGSGELASELFVARQTNNVTLEEVADRLGAFNAAFERIVGLPSGSLPVDPLTIADWFA